MGQDVGLDQGSREYLAFCVSFGRRRNVFGANGILNAGLDIHELKSMSLIHHLGTAIAVIGVVVALPIVRGGYWLLSHATQWMLST